METSTFKCSNRDCRVSETGKCVEGLVTDACPNFGKEPLPLDSNQAPLAEQRFIELSPAIRLSLDKAATVLRREQGRVIAVVGPHDAGKTSLIAGLYDLFQQGPIDGSHFNGSETLHAFEMSCHDARAASERSVPHIDRTPLGEVEFFHIGVTQLSTGSRFAVLIGDRAGEDYRSAANDVQIVSTFHEVRRADTLTFLVDGHRLAQSVTRHQVRAELLRLIQALVDGGGTSPRQKIAVVLTKLDDVQAAEHSARALADFSADITKLRSIFSSQFALIESFQIAASPKNTTVARGTGLPSLLAFWLGAVPPTTPKEPRRTSDERVFRRLKWEQAE